MKNNRKTNSIGIGVSLPEEMKASVDDRLQELKPFIKGFSHYVQLLIQADLEKDLLKLGSKGNRPFNLPSLSQTAFAA